MSHSKEFAFDIQDKVMIIAIQRPGRVEIIQQDYLGVTYRVAYWDNSERKQVWLYADEIEAR